ncbi:hypothetical protein BDW69DRAFT_170958 [Aspergillus filifer]
MDMICDWARDIYAEQVVLCLRRQAKLALTIPSQLTTKCPRIFDSYAEKVTRVKHTTRQHQGNPEDVSQEAKRRGTY